MQLIDELDRAIRYMTERKEDFYPSIISATDDVPHKVFADYLQDHNEDDPLLHRLRSELERQKSGKVRAVRLGDAYPLHDFVLHAIRTGHNNPSVRAMAGLTEVGHPPHSDLLNLLFHSDRPDDQDAAVWLHPEDSPSSHSSHAQLRRLNSHTLRNAGLETKVVRGTAYLLDHESNQPTSYGAPEIVFTAPINDHSELEAMSSHAHDLAKQRAEMEGASMGAVHFS